MEIYTQELRRLLSSEGNNIDPDYIASMLERSRLEQHQKMLLHLELEKKLPELRKAANQNST